MRRCPTCRADNPKLIHFGIYLCPTCGTVDADGKPVPPPPGFALTPGPLNLHEAAPTPVSDDTQPNPISAAPIPAPPRPVPLQLAPPRPSTPMPEPPRPVPMGAAPPHPRISSPDPLTVMPAPGDISRNSFTPPPPRDPRELLETGTGPPRILVVALAAFTVINMLGAAAVESNRTGGQLVRLGLQILFSLALLSGRAWARNASIVVNGLGLVVTVVLMLLPLPIPAKIVLGTSALATGFWLYVLFRRDVIDYCK